MSEPDPSRTSDVGNSSAAGPTASSLRDLTGRTLSDFAVERQLGQGGMGAVYLARQLSLSRPVAIKVLRPELSSNPTYLSRFEVEATAVARLNHPNIVQVYTLGNEADLRFIAMEYVQGTNLKDYLVKRGTVDLNLGLSIMRQTAQAIAAAGEVGLIHRDIKPENLLLTRKGQVKVADFGLCREQGSDALHLTQEGVTLGTPMYMSPEQVQGKPLDHRSDLYSMGVTFYHMFAGVTPFRGETAVAVALKHVQETPVSLAVHRPDLPPELVELVMKLMEKAPARRYQSARDVLRDLSRIREQVNARAGTGVSTETVPLSQASIITEAAKPKPKPARPPGRPWKERLAGLQVNRRWIATGIVAGLLLGGLLGWNNRAPNLLADKAPVLDQTPGLWIEPAWSSIARQASAREQLRHAQLGVRGVERVAAFLAVPGYFGVQSEASLTAYVQLARELLRGADAERLEDLATALDRGPTDAHRQLATLARAGADALRDRATEARDGLTSLSNIVYLDPPGLVELALEIVETASAQPSGTAMPGDPWRKLHADLQEALGIEALDRTELMDPSRRPADRP